MAFSLKQNESDARERLRAFWDGSSLGRPALRIVAKKPGFAEKAWPGEPLDAKTADLTPEWQAWAAERALGGTVFLAEAMPGFTPRLGSNLTFVAALAGGEYEYEDDTAWIAPIAELYERPLPSFDPAQPLVARIKACLRRVAETVGGRGFITPVVLLDGMTTLSMLRGVPELCIDLLDRPEAVRRWSDALTSVGLDAYEHFYQFITELGYGDTATWLGIMAEGRFEAVQCDFAVMLSPAQFERFVLPDLRRTTGYFDRSLYHLDGTCQMRFIDLLARLPDLNGIQWNPEPPAGPPVRWLDAFGEIRRRKLSLYVNCPSVEEAVTIAKAIGPDGLFLALPQFETVAEAERAIRAIERAC